MTVRLFGVPEAELTALCPFTDFSGAVATVAAAIQLSIPVARMEFLDSVTARGLAAYAKLDIPAVPTLFVDFHGTARGVEEAAENFKALAQEKRPRFLPRRDLAGGAQENLGCAARHALRLARFGAGQEAGDHGCLRPHLAPR